MDTQTTSNLFPDSLQIDERAKQHFTGITTWCIIIVIVALIGYVLNIADLMMKKSVPMQSEGFSMKLETKRSPAGIIIGLLIGLALNYFLYRFATQTQKAIATYDQDKLNNGFSNLKTYFVFFSIIMILICVASLFIIPALFN
jgi:hypothetical protein